MSCLVISTYAILMLLHASCCNPVCVEMWLIASLGAPLPPRWSVASLRGASQSFLRAVHLAHACAAVEKYHDRPLGYSGILSKFLQGAGVERDFAATEIAFVEERVHLAPGNVAG